MWNFLSNLKILKDWGVRANLATIGVIGFYVAVLYSIIAVAMTFEQVIAILGISQPVALLGLRWYFEKKKEETNEGAK